MAAELTDIWIKFFHDAGITNRTAAALYASTFAENEIQENMVGDLTRDILREIGITVMGHVLAILKHAKLVHSKAENEKIVAKTHKPHTTEPDIPVQQSVTSPAKKCSPAARIIAHYARPSSTDVDLLPVTTAQTYRLPSPTTCRMTPVASGSKVTDRLGIKKRSHSAIMDDEDSTNIRMTVQPMLSASTSRVRATPVLKVTDRLGIKKRTQDSVATSRGGMSVNQLVMKQSTSELKVTDRLGLKKRSRGVVTKDNVGDIASMGTKKQTISLVGMEKLVEEVPVKKIRRVLPEQEGSYKITMPSGTTQRSKQLLAKANMTSWHKTVFDRLGADGSVSSTTDVESPVKVGGSVFSRLGASTATSPDEPMAYKGVLKRGSPATSTTFKRTISKATPEVKKNKTAGILSNPTNAKQPSAKSRLGISTEKQASPGTVIRRKKVTLVKRSGERQIVYRDVIESAAPVSKCISFDADTRSRFRSDNIAVGSGSIIQPEEEEWDY